MSAKEPEEPAPNNQVAQIVARNALRVAELQMRLTQLENLFYAVKLCPERFSASVLLDAWRNLMGSQKT